MNPEDDPLEQLKALKAANDPLDELKKMKAPARPKIGQMGIPISDESPEEASYAQKALGGLASMAKDIPGVEALQAGARSLTRTHVTGKPNAFGFIPTARDEDYGEALSDIRAAEDAAPKWVRRGNRVIGGTVAGAVAPGSAVRQGAAYGAFSGLLKADKVGLKDRAQSAAVGAATGAVAPKVAQGLGTVARTLLAKPLGEVALARKAITEALDRINYGKAAAEGNMAAANPVPQIVGDAMDETDIRPYIREVQQSRTMQGANPAAIVREAYKLMTERQKLLRARALNTDDYKAGSELEQKDLEAAKRRLVDATSGIMPTFRKAVTEHAQAEGETDAFRAAADATKRIVSGSSGAAKNLEKKSPDAFMDSIQHMTPAEAQAALKGLLGRAKEVNRLTADPTKIFGVPRSVGKFSDLIPYISALDKQAGNKTSSLLAALGIGTTALAH